MLVPTDESNDMVKSTTDYGAKSEILLNHRLITHTIMMRNILKSDLPLKKTLKLRSMVTVVKAAFHEGSKYNPHVFLDKCLYEL